MLGGLIGAVLSCIPGLGALNLCFCLLNVVGAQIGLALYLKQNPHEKLSGSDAAVLGLISGATAGVLASLVQLLVWSPLLAIAGGAMGAINGSGFLMGAMLVGVLVYGGFGALGGFLGLLLFFKDRKAN